MGGAVYELDNQHDTLVKQDQLLISVDKRLARRSVVEDRKICYTSNSSRRVLRGVILAGIPSAKSGPGSDYWSQHPEELAQSVKQTKKLADAHTGAFPHTYCDKKYRFSKWSLK
jgi:hypothetical protein